MIKVEDIIVGYFRDVNILQGVSLQAIEGQITSIIGANGVGKSTLLKTICGYLHPNEGKIFLKKEDITRLDSYEICRKGISYISQRQNVFGNLTVEENLQLGAWTIRKDKTLVRKRLQENVNRFPVLAEKMKNRANTLSGGQQRMVEIARSLMIDPEVLILDEPTAGLAPRMAKVIYENILTLKHEEGLTILLVDQNIRQAVEYSDYIYVLELGKNKSDGSKDKFKDLKGILWS